MAEGGTRSGRIGCFVVCGQCISDYQQLSSAMCNVHGQSLALLCFGAANFYMVSASW